MQIPHGPEDRICPFHRVKMSKVCHTCPLWCQVRGTDRNTGKEMDDWMCSFSLLPRLLIENSFQQRATGAAVESFRNEMVKANVVALNIQKHMLLEGRDGERDGYSSEE